MQRVGLLPRSRPFLFRFLSLVILFVSLTGFAAENVILQLRNGDRITGSIISETPQQIVVSTVWSKEIVIPIDQILKREKVTAETKPAVDANQTPKPGETNAPTAKPGVTAATPATPLTPKPPQHWHGDLQAGLDLIYGAKDQRTYYGRGNVTYTQGRFRNIIDVNGSYGKTEGVLSANRVDGSIKTDFELGPRVYVYDSAGAGYDEVRKIDFRYAVGPGLGYHLLKLTNFVVNTEAGVNYQAEYRQDDSTTENFYLRLAEQVVWKINTRLSLDEKFEMFPRVEDYSQYRFRLEGSLKYHLNQSLFLSLTLLDQYDTSPAPGVPQNDMQIRSSIGVKF